MRPMRPPGESSSSTDGVVAGDAFGMALMACLEGGARPGVASEIVERDDGLIEAGDVARYFAPPEAWREIDRWSCDALGGRVLDIGAGAGRHSLFLQERGCDVTALDVSPLACAVCERRGATRVFTGTLEELAAASPEPFEGFALLGNNLGLLRDREYAPKLLAMLASIACPGATLVGSCLDPYQTDDSWHLQYHEANRRAGRMAGQVRLRIRHRRLATPWFGYLFASIEELGALVAGSGWRIDEVASDGPMYALRLQLDSDA